jgi:hypothetical protein
MINRAASHRKIGAQGRKSIRLPCLSIIDGLIFPTFAAIRAIVIRHRPATPHDRQEAGDLAAACGYDRVVTIKPALIIALRL